MMEKSATPRPLQIAMPKPRADQEKLTVALSTLADEDRWFDVKHDAESGQTIVAGRDELHLDTVIDRLRREFNIEDALRSHSKGEARMSTSYAGYAPIPLPPDGDPSAAMAIAR